MKERKETFQAIIQSRYSCRNFQNHPLKQDELDFILQMGMYAPSSLGLEPWKFYVATKKEDLAKIALVANGQKHVQECAAAIIIAARLDFDEYFQSKLQARNLPKEELEKRLQTYWPFIASMDREAKWHYAKEQTHLALANMANAATALGICSCIIGGFDELEMNKYLHLDTTKQRASIMLVLGYSQEPHPQKIRFPKEEVIDYL